MTTTRFDEHEIAASLSGFSALPDWLAAGMDGARIGDSLARQVPELADGRVTLVSCVPERLRAKGDEWLARYKLTVTEREGGTREVVLVGTLDVPSTQRPVGSVEQSAGTPFGEEGWSCVLADLGLRLRVQPHDEALPALPTLVEPEQAAALLQPLLRDAGYRDATIASCRPEVVRYKPGSRCTVVVHLRYADAPDGTGAPDDAGVTDGAVNAAPPPPSPVVLKTHQGDKGSTAWAAMTALWARPLAWQHRVALAEPLAFLPQERILVQGPVPEEQTLKELARKAIADGGDVLIDELREELDKTAAALAALHGSGVSYGRTATFEDELDEVREVVGRLALSVPKLAGAAEPLLGHLDRLAQWEPADPAVPAHHDFRPAQVLLDHGRVGFIDFDGASMAEPALDVGRFRAKLRDIGISALAASGQPLAGEPLARNLQLLDGLCDGFLTSYLQWATVSRPRVLLWESCDLLTAMLHAWTKVRLARLEPRLTVLSHQLRTSGLLSLARR